MHESLNLQTRRRLIAYASELDFVEREAIVILERGSATIEDLSLLNGFECHECEQICSSESLMIEHCEKETKMNRDMWHKMR